MKKEEKDIIFFVDKKAKIIKAGKEMPFSELKKGMQVSVKYRKDKDRMIALRIKVLNNGEGEKNLRSQ